MALIGFTMEANFYPLALTGQNALPRHIGFSAGVMLGLSIGLGACISSLLGVLADAEGLRASLVAIAAIELLACGSRSAGRYRRKVRTSSADPAGRAPSFACTFLRLARALIAARLADPRANRHVRSLSRSAVWLVATAVAIGLLDGRDARPARHDPHAQPAGAGERSRVTQGASDQRRDLHACDRVLARRTVARGRLRRASRWARSPRSSR